MAKPIRATPVLRGKQVDNFLKEWINESKNPSKKRINFIRNAEKKTKFFDSKLWNK